LPVATVTLGPPLRLSNNHRTTRTARAVRPDMRRLPYLTCLLCLVSIYVFYFLPSSNPVMSSWAWVLHPFIHQDSTHLWENIVELVIVGIIAESWSGATPSKIRYLAILLLSYLISLAVLIFKLTADNQMLVGASGLIFALWGFDLAYYLDYAYQSKLSRASMLVPIGIGIVGSTLVREMVLYLTEPTVRKYGLSPHAMAAALAFALGVILSNQLHQKGIQ
jgi:membrane associated rhomboid family serine protease